MTEEEAEYYITTTILEQNCKRIVKDKYDIPAGIRFSFERSKEFMEEMLVKYPQLHFVIHAKYGHKLECRHCRENYKNQITDNR